MATRTLRLLDEAELYSLLPLKDDMVRVLDVHSGLGDTEKLAGWIRVASLSKNPKFVALSYCWDYENSGFSREIEVESDHGAVTMRISETAYEALVDIRDHLGSMAIWIDAICINQRCVPERESQIRLMKEIYSQASAVYVHMGAATESSSAALDWMTQVSRRQLRGIGILGPGSWDGPKWCAILLILRDCWTG
jgi:hypothetical protein